MDLQPLFFAGFVPIVFFIQQLLFKLLPNFDFLLQYHFKLSIFPRNTKHFHYVFILPALFAQFDGIQQCLGIFFSKSYVIFLPSLSFSAATTLLNFFFIDKYCSFDYWSFFFCRTLYKRFYSLMTSFISLLHHHAVFLL